MVAINYFDKRLTPITKGAIFFGEIPAKADFDCLPFAKAKQGAVLPTY